MDAADVAGGQCFQDGLSCWAEGYGFPASVLQPSLQTVSVEALH